MTPMTELAMLASRAPSPKIAMLCGLSGMKIADDAGVELEEHDVRDQHDRHGDADAGDLADHVPPRLERIDVPRRGRHDHRGDEHEDEAHDRLAEREEGERPVGEASRVRAVDDEAELERRVGPDLDRVVDVVERAHPERGHERPEEHLDRHRAAEHHDDVLLVAGDARVETRQDADERQRADQRRDADRGEDRGGRVQRAGEVFLVAALVRAGRELHRPRRRAEVEEPHVPDERVDEEPAAVRGVAEAVEHRRRDDERARHRDQRVQLTDDDVGEVLHSRQGRTILPSPARSEPGIAGPRRVVTCHRPCPAEVRTPAGRGGHLLCAAPPESVRVGDLAPTLTKH